MHIPLPSYREIPRDRRLPEIPMSEVGNLWAPWRDEAACRDYISEELLTPGDFTDDYSIDAIERARELCAACPVSALCLSDALRDRKSHGVRGGFYFIMGGLDPESREIIKRLYNQKTRPVPGTH